MADGGGVDASVPLGVTGGQSAGLTGQGSLAAPNALGMLSVVAKTQNELNQARMFEQTFAARKRFGQIMASSPDVDTGYATALQDPAVMAYAPELVGSAATARNTIIGSMGQVQTQGQDSFSHLLKGLPAVIQDPTQWGALKQTSLELASPVIRDRLGKSMDYLFEGLTSGLPADPVAAKEAQLQRLVGWAVAGGVGDSIPRILGNTAQIDVGPEIQTGKITPSQGQPGWLQQPGQPAPQPGSFIGTNNPLTKGFSPQITPAGAIPFKEGGSAQGPGGLPAQAALAPVAQEVSDEPERMSADGTPFLPKDYVMKGPPKRGDVIGGVPIGPAATISNALAESFTGPELHEYKNTQQTTSMLYEMNKAFDVMAKDGGFLTPGTAGEARASIGKMFNTFADITGMEKPFDAMKVASAEDILKVTQRMGISVLSSLLGTQREAADTIRNMTEKGVPGVSNTPLGAKLLISSIRQATERQIEMYDFKNKWQEKHGGDLTGADVAFNELHPAEKYIKRAMDEFGLDNEGFTSEAAVDRAAEQGLLDKAQYREAMKSVREREKKKE